MRISPRHVARRTEHAADGARNRARSRMVNWTSMQGRRGAQSRSEPNPIGPSWVPSTSVSRRFTGGRASTAQRSLHILGMMFSIRR